jgi:uncharacterized protein (DUF2236 family)
MDEGLFDDSAVIRRVAGEGLLLAGVAQGVLDHSSFADRPLDRLRTTMSYVYGVLYGTRAEAQTISRAVAAMHSKVTGPGYTANDPQLQVWVNATLFDTAMLLYERVFGPLTPAEADICYQQYNVLATAIGCPESAWPADRAAFSAYWDHMIATIEVSDSGRRIANTLLWPEGLPVALRPAVPVNRFLTVGLLPGPVRDGFGFPWSPRREKLLDRVLSGAAAVYPRLPGRVRHAPKDLYLRDYRKRLARRRNPLAAR